MAADRLQHVGEFVEIDFDQSRAHAVAGDPAVSDPPANGGRVDTGGTGGAVDRVEPLQ